MGASYVVSTTFDTVRELTPPQRRRLHSQGRRGEGGRVIRMFLKGPPAPRIAYGFDLGTAALDSIRPEVNTGHCRGSQGRHRLRAGAAGIYAGHGSTSCGERSSGILSISGAVHAKRAIVARSAGCQSMVTCASW